MSAAAQLVEAIHRLDRPGPSLVAIDGPSAAGKSRLTAEVASQLPAVVIDGDDFYAGGTAEEWDAMSPAEKAAHCIDWRRQRPVLEALARGQKRSWHAYDWGANDGRLMDQPTVVSPAPSSSWKGCTAPDRSWPTSSTCASSSTHRPKCDVAVGSVERGRALSTNGPGVGRRPRSGTSAG
jgi:hypothetical protein